METFLHILQYIKQLIAMKYKSIYRKFYYEGYIFCTYSAKVSDQQNSNIQ